MTLCLLIFTFLMDGVEQKNYLKQEEYTSGCAPIGRLDFDLSLGLRGFR